MDGRCVLAAQSWSRRDKPDKPDGDHSASSGSKPFRLGSYGPVVKNPAWQREKFLPIFREPFVT